MTRRWELTSIKVYEVEADPDMDGDEVREAWSCGELAEHASTEIDGHIEMEEIKD